MRGAQTLVRMARFYGFRNIQNLVRRLKPVKASRMPGARGGGGVRRVGAAEGRDAKAEYAYVEVMACPGGCTNGGGQVKVAEVESVRAEGGMVLGGSDAGVGSVAKPGPKEQKEWLGRVDEAYFSASEGSEAEDEDGNGTADREMLNVGEGDVVDGISHRFVHDMLDHWARVTGVELQRLICTSYRKVESDVGKKKQSDVERVAGLASSLGGGW